MSHLAMHLNDLNIVARLLSKADSRAIERYHVTDITYDLMELMS